MTKFLEALVGVLATVSVGLANDAMPAGQQNALVQKYCAVCHTDKARNGGLSLEHFDAARPDPGVAAMMLGKLKTGAIGAAGITRPDAATIEAWTQATAAEAAGANQWRVERAKDAGGRASIVTASIVQEIPAPKHGDVPDSYRLTVSCRPDTREAGMELSWSPGSPKADQVFSAFVDGTALSTYKADGVEKMGNGQDGNSGPGSIMLYGTQSGGANRPMALPAQTLTVRDAFPNETVVFPFGELPSPARQALAACFEGGSNSH